MASRETLLKILDLARWAPSGDNTQPWRFEIVADDRIAIHGNDTREWCLYDFNGHASHMAHGALLETLRIAASGEGLAATWQLRPGSDDKAPVFDVTLSAAPGLAPDPLLPFVEGRSVQRRPMRTTPLTDAQRAALAAAPGPGYRVRFFEAGAARRKVAGLLWRNAYLRLTCPEAYPVHKEIIEWRTRFSKDRIPEQAVGVDGATARLMEWVMASWGRVQFFNKYLGGTIAPRVQLDYIPAIACAAHLLVLADEPAVGVEAHVRGGVVLQRVWLTAAAVGLHLQPEMTPLIFRWYARHNQHFSALPEIRQGAAALADEFERIGGFGPDQGLTFFCRVGVSDPPRSRSLRKSVEELLLPAR
ncbi:nitroreductase family protein [Zoogloea sp.]|uniref:nitroreductase family protein n=1 Tax=Zoogloea sp. TaxID=49181 RepID=UPI0035AF24BE